jgi:hypothetical protein
MGCAAPIFVCARHTPNANIAEYIAQILRKYCAQTKVQTKTQSKSSGILGATQTKAQSKGGRAKKNASQAVEKHFVGASKCVFRRLS